MKLLAWLTEDALRCKSCGTAEYEWEDRFAYIAGVHVCPGCALREKSSDMAKDVAGGTIVLLSGEAKKAELARQRETYRASRQKGD